MMLKILRVKTLKILLNTEVCLAHVECDVLASFLTTFYNILQNMYRSVGAVESFLHSCCMSMPVEVRKRLDIRSLHQLLENTK